MIGIVIWSWLFAIPFSCLFELPILTLEKVFFHPLEKKSKPKPLPNGNERAKTGNGMESNGIRIVKNENRIVISENEIVRDENEIVKNGVEIVKNGNMTTQNENEIVRDENGKTPVANGGNSAAWMLKKI